MAGARRIAALVAGLGLAVAGCASSGDSSGGSSAAGSGSSGGAISGTVTVFAAASLTEAFTTLAHAFETAHHGVSVKLNFAASSTLAQQINQGAPADVFASASPKNMQQVVDAGGASSSSNFVKNVLEIAVPPSNPARIAGLADLARSGVKVALCQPQVPCGSVAATVFSNAGVEVKPVTLEQDVKSTLTKVELNEVDAGLVYVTDVRTAGSKVKGIVIPADVNASTEYPIAALRHAPNSVGAQAFTAFVLSAAGQAVLVADGFEKP
ncbi:MAG: molybdenum transporter, periplasmic molybdate-binding protein [Pseudonocardiales bacterium]|nr:molybdenum transporter, periplasmic molybdate-binding protein [Pseudonocardiales bacterium]